MSVFIFISPVWLLWTDFFNKLLAHRLAAPFHVMKSGQHRAACS